MSKPSEELLGRAREHLRQTGYLYADMDKNPDIVAQFGEQIVRECARIASLDAEQFEAEFPDLWKAYYDHNELTLVEMDKRAILRKFGLKE